MSVTYFIARNDGIREASTQQRGVLHSFLRAFAAWRLRRRQRAELYALSDGTLKDIGVNWAEIEGIVSSPDRDASGRVR